MGEEGGGVGNHFFFQEADRSECLFNDRKGMYCRKRAGKKKFRESAEFTDAWLVFTGITILCH